MIKIILAEDHEIVRNGLKILLEEEDGFIVTGEANNGLEVLSLFASGTEADIVLTDLSMPEMDGITLAGKLAKEYPEVKVIILSMLDNERYIFDAFGSGIKGYLLKSTSREEMIFSIRHVAGNREFICTELGMKMLKRALRSGARRTGAEQVSGLTPREREILTLIAEGYTNSEIAEKIFTSRRTVEGHRQKLIDKTGVRNTAQLISFACRSGII